MDNIENSSINSSPSHLYYEFKIFLWEIRCSHFELDGVFNSVIYLGILKFMNHKYTNYLSGKEKGVEGGHVGEGEGGIKATP